MSAVVDLERAAATLAAGLRERARRPQSLDEQVEKAQDLFVRFLQEVGWSELTSRQKESALVPLLRCYLPSPMRLGIRLGPKTAKLRGIVAPLSLTSDVVLQIDAAWKGALRHFVAAAARQNGPDASGASSEERIEALRHRCWTGKMAPGFLEGDAAMDIARTLVLDGAHLTPHAFRVLRAWIVVCRPGAARPTADAHVSDDTSLWVYVSKLRIIVEHVMRQHQAGALGEGDYNVEICRRLHEAWTLLGWYAREHAGRFASERQRWAHTEEHLTQFYDGMALLCPVPGDIVRLFRAPAQTRPRLLEDEALLAYRVAPAAELQHARLPPCLDDFSRSMQDFLRNPAGMLKPRHILLSSRPGMGKTAAAGILAHKHGLPLYTQDDGSGNQSSLQHETAERRSIFLDSVQAEAVRRNSYAIVLFDEAHTLFPLARAEAPGESAQDSGAMARVMDGIRGERRLSRVFVIACTNYPELVEPAVRSRFLSIRFAEAPGDWWEGVLDEMVQTAGHRGRCRTHFPEFRLVIAGLSCRDIKDVVSHAQAAVGMSTAPNRNTAFWSCLRRRFYETVTAGEATESRPLPAQRGEGRRIDATFAMPLGSSIAMFGYRGNYWLARWHPAETGPELVVERTCGQIRTSAARMLLLGPNDEKIAAVGGRGDNLRWSFFAGDIEPPPGSRAYSEQLGQPGHIRCLIDLSFERGGFKDAPVDLQKGARIGAKVGAVATLFGGLGHAALVGNLSASQIGICMAWAPMTAAWPAIGVLQGGGAAGYTVGCMLGMPVALAGATGGVVAGPLLGGAMGLSIMTGAGYAGGRGAVAACNYYKKAAAWWRGHS